MPFYNPFVTRVLRIPMIVYPHQSLGNVLGRGRINIENHLVGLQSCNPELTDALSAERNFQIGFLSAEDREVITVVWNFVPPVLGDSKAFRDFNLDESIMTDVESLVVVTKEERLRKYCRSDIGKYLGARPALPAEYLTGEDF